ncbi:MAG: PilZ domain-containing protein [Myxococcota bacterium]
MNIGDRRDRRLNVAMQVQIVDGDAHESFLTKNISVGGVFVITTHRYPIGAYLSLRIDYKGVEMLTGARVTHIQRDGVGVRFWNPSDDLLHAVKRVIDDLLASGGHTDERRREPRELIEDTPILWRTEGVERRASLVDLSLSGARIADTEPPGEEQKILVLLPTPAAEQDAISVELVGSDAIVRRSMGESFGIEFDGPSAEFRLAVAKLLQQSGRSSSRQV